MDRLVLDEPGLAACAAEAQGYYVDKSEPAPGSNLRLGDDLIWAGCIVGRIVWGYDTNDMYSVYSPEFFGTYPMVVDVYAITDRAPVEPDMPPFPIYPEPEQQHQQGAEHGHGHEQAGGKHHKGPRHFSVEEQRKLLASALARMPEDKREAARAKIRAERPELLEPTLGDHRHDAIPPERPHKGER